MWKRKAKVVRRHKNKMVCLAQQNKDDKDDRDLRAAYRYTKGGKKPLVKAKDHFARVN